MSRKKITGICVFLLLVLAAAVMAAAVVPGTGTKPADTAAQATESERALPDDAVEIGGVLCTPKPNVKTYLFMGLDSEGKIGETGQTAGAYDGTGQSDVLQLLVVDRNAGIYTRLPINRDTMTDVRILDDGGYYLSTKPMQISLASVTGGDDFKTHCENTVNAVSRFLLDQPIDGYAAFSMDAVGTLNHLAGGVTVTIEDDFSEIDPTLAKGETVTLTDEQAVHYVRSRKGMEDDSNENRMARQAYYLEELEPVLMKKCKEDTRFALTLYDALKPYMVTDMSRNLFIKLAAGLLDLTGADPLSIEGTDAVGEHGYKEFTPDEDSLTETVRTLFYDVWEKE